MSGIRAGTFFSCRCGAEIIFTLPCPEAAASAGPVCACGARFSPLIAADLPDGPARETALQLVPVDGDRRGATAGAQ